MIDHSEQRVGRTIAAGTPARVERGADSSRRWQATPITFFVALSVKTLNPRLTVVARASKEDAEEKMRRAGTDTIFTPYSIGGHRLAQALVQPHAVTLSISRNRPSASTSVRSDCPRLPAARCVRGRWAIWRPRQSGLIVLQEDDFQSGP